MTLITPEAVRAAAPGHPEPAKAAAALARAAERYGIRGRKATAMLLAQLGHESNLMPVTENLSYSAERIRQVWPTRFPTVDHARPYARNPQALGNKVYGGRMGNTQPGDGYRYRGRGYVQITGRDMYRSVGRALGLDLEGNPDLLLTHDVSALAACEFLKRKGLIDDLGSGDVRSVTRVINGGYNGLPDREARYARVLAALPEPVPALPPQRFLLVPKGGGEAAAWNGRDNPYGGNTLGPELLAVLDLTYPTPGGPWAYGNLKLWRRRDGTFVLERA